MARREFDLSSMIDVVSKHALPQSGSSSLSRPEGGARLDTISGPEVKMIPLDDILNNKANFYTVDKDALKPLADSIAMDGLQQYPVVMPHPEQEGSSSCSPATGAARPSGCWWRTRKIHGRIFGWCPAP